MLKTHRWDERGQRSHSLKIETSEGVRQNLWDLHSRKVSSEMIGTGRVRDVDVIVAGQKGNFEVQLNVGFWGRTSSSPP